MAQKASSISAAISPLITELTADERDEFKEKLARIRRHMVKKGDYNQQLFDLLL